jgi:steroid delta-isomerase-like uncharacterized protein
MSPEENKAVVRRFVDEAQSRGRVDAVDEYLSDSFVDHSPLPGLSPDRDGVKQLFAMFHSAFSDFRTVVHDQIAEGDRVVTRKTFRGTHEGEFLGIPATGREVSIEVIDILRLEGDKITEHWCVVDQLGLMRQLGAI